MSTPCCHTKQPNTSPFLVSFHSPGQHLLLTPQAPLGLLLICSHMAAPQPLEKGNPQDPVVGAGAGAGCPGLSLSVGWGGSAASPPWQWGLPPHSRVQMQEVHPRQPLHSCRSQAADPSSAPDPSEARRDRDPRWENAGMPAEPTPGMLTGGICSQDSRSPWAWVARLDWEETGSPHPESQDSSSVLTHSWSHTFLLGAGVPRGYR